MEIDLELIQANLEKNRSLSESKITADEVQRIENKELARRLTENLWPKLTNLYGPKFTSFYGETPSDDWVTVIVGLTGRQIADGLNRCIEDYAKWPPAAAVFRAICFGKDPRNIDKQGYDANWQHKGIERANRERAEQLSLPDLSSTERAREAGKKTLESMKGKFFMEIDKIIEKIENAVDKNEMNGIYQDLVYANRKNIREEDWPVVSAAINKRYEELSAGPRI